MNKLFWCTTPCNHENWFVVADSQEKAVLYHAYAEGFEIDYPSAVYICNITSECKDLAEVGYDDDDELEGYWPTLEQLQCLGFKITEDEFPRVVVKDGKIFREGGAVQSLLIEEMTKSPGVYVIQIRRTSKYKIGITKHIKTRLKQFQTGNPEPLDMVVFMETEDPRKLESLLHQEFKEKRLSGEWFELNEKDLLIIKIMGNQIGAHVVDAAALRRG